MVRRLVKALEGISSRPNRKGPLSAWTRKERPCRMGPDIHQPRHHQRAEHGHQNKEEQGPTAADAEDLGEEISVFRRTDQQAGREAHKEQRGSTE